jgi:hypothetical protein
MEIYREARFVADVAIIDRAGISIISLALGMIVLGPFIILLAAIGSKVWDGMFTQKKAKG